MCSCDCYAMIGYCSNLKGAVHDAHVLPPVLLHKNILYQVLDIGYILNEAITDVCVYT